jgi:hypothetical protein
MNMAYKSKSRRRDPASRLGSYKDEAHRLYYEVFHADQRGISSGRSEEAKHILANILQETGHAKMAGELRRHRGKIYGTLFGQKVQRTLFGAPQSSYAHGTRKPKKKVLIAQLRSGEWLHVDKMVGDPSDGNPYFVGPGTGYDIHRFIVWAYDEGSAIEIAEEKWPHLLFDEVDATDVDEDDQDIFPIQTIRKGKDVWFKSGWARHSQDVRIFQRVKRVEHAREIGYGTAVLKSGETVEYK